MKFEHSVVIQRSIEDVFELVGNPDNDTKWGSLIVESEPVSPGELGVGSAFRQVATFMGGRVNAMIEVTAYEAGKLVCTKASQPVALENCRTFEDTPEGTRLTFVTEVDPQGTFSVGGSILKHIAQRQMEADMEDIKERLEGRGDEEE